MVDVPVRTKAVLKSPQSRRSASSGDDRISRSVVECASPLALWRGGSLRDFRMNFDHQTSGEASPLFLDRNWPVSFHKPTMKAVNGKVGQAQSRAYTAA
jgi:hypothetical protein